MFCSTLVHSLIWCSWWYVQRHLAIQNLKFKRSSKTFWAQLDLHCSVWKQHAIVRRSTAHSPNPNISRYLCEHYIFSRCMLSVNSIIQNCMYDIYKVVIQCIISVLYSYILWYYWYSMDFPSILHLIYKAWIYLINLLSIICSFDFLKDCSPNIVAP